MKNNGRKILPFMPDNCAVRERTAGGVSIGRCMLFVGANNICPKHGDVKKIQDKYKKTGKLGEDPRRKDKK